MVVDTITLLSLMALLLLTGYLIYTQVYSENTRKKRYIDALERQLKENNQDISLLGKRLAEISRHTVSDHVSPQHRVAVSTTVPLKPSSRDDLLLQISILETKLKERDQQISLLKMEVSSFEQHKKILLQRDDEINSLYAALAEARARLNDAMSRLNRKD
ncbi:MAG: hypothetical protein KTR32_09575 [Granulosicoccus sp.]|nr:hypothetical protein [Granulosicoccus sp.]